MTIVQTSTLTDRALDWAVATCENEPIMRDPMGFGSASPGGYWVWDDHGAGNAKTRYWQIGKKYSPSTNWAQGGPIIEREKLDIEWRGSEVCRATCEWLDEPFYESFGPTALIAAMRCYVASKLGDEVDVPEELL